MRAPSRPTRPARPPSSTSARTSHARVTLYRRDARKVLPTLAARSISVLLTDPPYPTVTRSPGSQYLRRWFPKSLTWSEIGSVLALARSRMRADGIAFMMTNSEGLGLAIEALQGAGFTRVRPIVWDKRTPGLGGGLRHQTEHILVGYLPGSRTLAGVDLVSVAPVGPGTAGRYPTEKPADLGRALAVIARVGRRDVVLDPFCGSGALLVGARERGARVIGVDVAGAAIKRATARLSGPETAAPAPAPPARAARPPKDRENGEAHARRPAVAKAKARPTRSTRAPARRRRAP